MSQHLYITFVLHFCDNNMTEEHGYTTVRLPDFLIDQIDDVVRDKINGFRSRNEFCVDAVRRALKDFKNNGGETNGSISNK